MTPQTAPFLGWQSRLAANAISNRRYELPAAGDSAPGR